jgi:hypothetical protein
MSAPTMMSVGPPIIKRCSTSSRRTSTSIRAAFSRTTSTMPTRRVVCSLPRFGRPPLNWRNTQATVRMTASITQKAKMDNVGDVALNGGPQTKSPAALGVTGMDEVGAPRLPLNRTCRTHESKYGAFSRTGKEGGVHHADWLGFSAM